MFFPNYFGQQIQSSSNELLDAAYESAWYEENCSYKKHLFILMENLKRSVKFSLAGYNVNFNFKEFVEVCNAIYSLHAILKQLHKHYYY
jgi:hypothetical protein